MFILITDNVDNLNNGLFECLTRQDDDTFLAYSFFFSMEDKPWVSFMKKKNRRKAATWMMPRMRNMPSIPSLLLMMRGVGWSGGDGCLWRKPRHLSPAVAPQFEEEDKHQADLADLA